MKRRKKNQIPVVKQKKYRNERNKRVIDPFVYKIGQRL